jgi:capsular polysaccharide biosynthesis protein
MQTEKPDNNGLNTTGEIDLIRLARYIWEGRRVIIKVTAAFLIAGIIIAFVSPKQYKSEARMLPEITEPGGGASSLLKEFSGLGGLGGFNIPALEGIDAIGPDLYPEVLRSTPFFLELLRHRVKVKTDGNTREVAVMYYVEELMRSNFSRTLRKYTINLGGTLGTLFAGASGDMSATVLSNEGIYYMNKAQYDAIKTLSDRIIADADQRSGVITVTAEFPDPFVTAQIAHFAVNYLTDYITEYRLEKVRRDLKFFEDRYAEKENEFRKAQLALARYRDANINVISSEVRTEEQRLQDHYNLAFNGYNAMAQQLEQARTKVQEETPVIKILEPVIVPVVKSKPGRFLIMVVSILLGGIISISYLLIKTWIGHYQLKE